MPPKHDLRGGRASADSFAISSSIFVALTSRSFFAAENRELRMRPYPSLVHELNPVSAPLAFGRGFFRTLDMIWSRKLDGKTSHLNVCRCNGERLSSRRSLGQLREVENACSHHDHHTAAFCQMPPRGAAWR